MMDLMEIRWHGRGGQGVVTAAKLLAETAMEAGYDIQAFPDYGPERSGAPIRAFTRLSRSPIRVHSQIEAPDIVVVLDESLLGRVPVTAGLKPGGWLVVNTAFSSDPVRAKAGGYRGNLATLDATRIALDTLKRHIPNTPLLGALVRLTDLFPLEDLTCHIHRRLVYKFGEEVVLANLEAVRRGYEEVRIEAVPERETGGEKAAMRGPMAWFELTTGGLIIEAGNAVEYPTGDWRTFRPIVDMNKCTHCLYCWLYCPDDAILVQDGKFVGFDYEHCKGCGVCAAVCPPKVISMVEEAEAGAVTP